MTLDRDSLREQLRCADEQWGGLHPMTTPGEVARRLFDMRQQRMQRRVRQRLGIGAAASLLLLAVAGGFWISQRTGAPSLAERGPSPSSPTVQQANRESAEPTIPVPQLQRELQLVRADLAQLQSQRLALLREEVSREFSRATSGWALQQQLADARAQRPTLVAVDQPIDFGF